MTRPDQLDWRDAQGLTRDKFTLNDLVSHNDKHNEANGEDATGLHMVMRPASSRSIMALDGTWKKV